MPDEYDYHTGKLPDFTYVSRLVDPAETSLWFDESGDADLRKFRMLSHVFDSEESCGFATVRGETVLSVTPGGRQEVVAKVYENDNQVIGLTIQRFTAGTGKPHKLHFSFGGAAVDKLYKFLQAAERLRFQSPDKQRVHDSVIDHLLLDNSERREYVRENEDLFLEIARHNITKADIVALGYRKAQLAVFECLLNDAAYFEARKAEWSKQRDEDVWQQFFETNPWIFGYGLSYIFSSPASDDKLEQVVAGYDFNQPGKRVDALMRTRGLISSLCFVEIKTHMTPLLRDTREYRPGCWMISGDLAGSVAQIQKTVQKALSSLRSKVEFRNDVGDPTGEVAYLYQPKAYVVIGSLAQFQTPNGINEEKYGSFELFRQNVVNPEIITFDELFSRAQFIVRRSEG